MRKALLGICASFALLFIGCRVVEHHPCPENSAQSLSVDLTQSPLQKRQANQVYITEVKNRPKLYIDETEEVLGGCEMTLALSEPYPIDKPHAESALDSLFIGIDEYDDTTVVPVVSLALASGESEDSWTLLTTCTELQPYLTYISLNPAVAYDSPERFPLKLSYVIVPKPMPYIFNSWSRKIVAGGRDGTGYKGVIPVPDSNFREVDVLPIPIIATWIPPVGLLSDGTLAPPEEQCSHPEPSPQLYPAGCMADIYVTTNHPYTADINIYNDLGENVHHSTQRFGYCGELENSERKQGPVYSSWLVWNMKDKRGRLAAPGVYMWKIRYTFENRGPFIGWYKTGIACHSDSERKCFGD